MSNVPTVSIHAYNRVKKENEVLRRLLNGEWVDTEAVQETLGITFQEGMRMFDFGRTVKWNKAPLNGQKVITKFRLCEKTIGQLGVFPFDA
jgi:hypothetical protein